MVSVSSYLNRSGFDKYQFLALAEKELGSFLTILHQQWLDDIQQSLDLAVC
jgi:hypothetical protein